MELSLESVQTIRGSTLLKCTHFPEDSTWEFGGMNGFAQRKVRLSIFKSLAFEQSPISEPQRVPCMNQERIAS